MKHFSIATYYDKFLVERKVFESTTITCKRELLWSLKIFVVVMTGGGGGIRTLDIPGMSRML